METLAAERLSQDLLASMRPPNRDGRVERFCESLLTPLLAPLPHEQAPPYLKTHPGTGKTYAYVLGDEALSIVQAPPWPGPESDELPHVGVMSYPLARGEWTVSCEAQALGSDQIVVESVFYYDDRELLEVLGKISDGRPDDSQQFAHALAHKVDARVAAFSGS